MNMVVQQARQAAAQQAKHDGSGLGFGRVTGPVGGALLALFASLLIHYRYMPVWVPAAFAAGGGLAMWAVDRHKKRPARASIYAMACWAVGAAWASWTGWQGSYGWPAWTVLGVAALMAGFLSFLAGVEEPAPPAPLPNIPLVPAPVEDRRAAALREALNQALGLKPGKTFTVESVDMWAGNTGYTARVRFPTKSGITLDKVQGVTALLQADLELRKGCPVRVSGGDTAAEVFIDVTLINKLKDTIPFPPIKRRSVLDPFPLGIYADGTQAMISAHQDSALFVARRGGGKTVLVWDLIAQLAQCDNTLIWLIDCNGAGAATFWMAPYARGEIARPIIDWVAGDPEEALKMAAAALAIALDRKSRYATLLLEHNTDILPFSADIPAIQIVVDEGHEIFGDDAPKLAKRVAAMLKRVQQIGRAMGVQIHVTSQRGTLTYLPSDVKMGCSVKAVGPVETDGEIGGVLDWAKGLRTSDLTGMGQWFLRTSPAEPPKIFKTYALRSDEIARIAAACSDWRPELDGPGQAKGKQAYGERFDRMGPWLRRLAGDVDAELYADSDEVDVDALITGRDIAAEAVAEASGIIDSIKAKTRRQFEQARAEAAAEAAEAAAQMRPPQESSTQAAAPEPARQEAVQAGAAVRDTVEDLPELPADLRRELDDTIAALEGVRQSRAEAVEGLLEGLLEGPRFVYDLIVNATPPGARTANIKAAALAARLTQREATVHDWLAALKAQGLVTDEVAWGVWAATETAGTNAEGQAAA